MEIRDYLSRIGKKGASKGGKAAAARMTPEERSERARKAVAAREAKRKGARNEKAANYDELLMRARHEAGHAVCASAVGWSIVEIDLCTRVLSDSSIIGGNANTLPPAYAPQHVSDRKGEFRVRTDEERHRSLRYQSIVRIFGGPAAAVHFYGDLRGCKCDLDLVEEELATLGLSQRRTAQLKMRAYFRACRIINRRREAVERLARALIDAPEQRLATKEIERILRAKREDRKAAKKGA